MQFVFLHSIQRLNLRLMMLTLCDGSKVVYSMAKAAATPTAATAISLDQDMTPAAPVKAVADGLEVAKVPLADGAGAPVAAVGAWI